MKNIVTAGLIAGALAASSGASAQTIEQESAAIEQVLATYETALNGKDTDTIMSLYTDDGVFMPQHSPPQAGKDAVRAAYVGVFDAITLDIEFIVDEIEPVSPDWAFARTRSEGTVTINATGQSAPEANQEMFLFHRSADRTWRIARYIFSTTNPPRQ
ncbi:SgcJ/EcaC family oxidoreductase [Hyphomonas sp.]|uniref:YybH family protein n=1 Tax=Hyphomonas sp. TaxID=87 RepID=UPI0025C4583B|nr:SgcJ/EcaC family oxidoreductase [Hyphomonas sp.]MBI1401375.1 SgcJ/EcaC family oxidoreductase [Hyphomonas sp.]